MLCCLLGAFLAGNLFAAWRFAAAAVRRGVPAWAGRAMLGCVAAASLAAASATFAAHADHGTATALAGDAPCIDASAAAGS